MVENLFHSNKIKKSLELPAKLFWIIFCLQSFMLLNKKKCVNFFFPQKFIKASGRIQEQKILKRKMCSKYTKGKLEHHLVNRKKNIFFLLLASNYYDYIWSTSFPLRRHSFRQLMLYWHLSKWAKWISFSNNISMSRGVLMLLTLLFALSLALIINIKTWNVRFCQLMSFFYIIIQRERLKWRKNVWVNKSKNIWSNNVYG